MNEVKGGSIQRSATTVAIVTANQAATASDRPRSRRRRRPLRRLAKTATRPEGARPDQAPWTTRFALVTLTGVSGTSWWPALLPVFTAAILSTTSIPSVTQPKTA